jgi:phage gp29-like protein
MAVILYDQFGREIKKQKAPEKRALAVAPILDSFRDYVTDGLTPERLATIFKEADGGNVSRQAALFEQLEEKDGHLLCERDKRKNIILDLDFEVEPASDDARDIKVAEFIGDFFKNHSDWDDCLVSLQDAVGKGFAAMEIHWDVSEGMAMPGKLEFLEQQRFLFTDNNGLLRRFPLLLSDEHAMGAEIPEWKVLLHQYGGKSGHATRSGIYRVAAWMVLFKHYAIKDWVIFCETYGMPLRLGRYDQGASSEDRAALLAAISSLGTDAAGIISKSTEIEFVEASQGSVKGDLWKMLAEFCNGEISKAILGQTLTADVGESGSYAASKTHDGIRLDLLKADGRAEAATIRNQLIRPMVGFNFGWDTRIPGYFARLDEDEDLDAKASWVEKITRIHQVPASWLNKEFNIPEPKKGELMVGGGGQQQPAPVQLPFAAKLLVAKDRNTAGFTEEQQALEELGDEAIEQTHLDANEQKLLETVRSSASYEEAMEKIIALYPDMDMSSLQAVMEMAAFNAEMFGRKVARDGI